MNLLLLLPLLLFTTLRSAASSPPLPHSNHRYNVGDPVPFFVNKVGPFDNPSETYQFYDLPFCRPGNVKPKKETLGEVLNGDRLANALYELKFREDKSEEVLCETKLGADDVARFRDAVVNDFYFQMYYDDLPLWGFIGKVEDPSVVPSGGGGGGVKEVKRYYLYTHVRFDVLYNGDRVIEVSAFSDPNYAVGVTEDREIDVKFTYSVFWNETSSGFGRRTERFLRSSWHPVHQKVHWFSFVNALVIVLLLMGLLAHLIMRRLKNDLRKCSSNGDEEENKEVGWKYIHGDVFRCPQNMTLFCAVLGTGTQLLTLTLLVFVLAFVGIIYPYSRGTLSTSFILVYALTSVIGGYSASSFHNQFAQTGWERSVFLTGILHAGPSFVILSFLNTVAVSYGSTAALPFGTIIVVLLIYVFLSLPLLALGGVIGYIFRSEFQAPSATKRYPREIPVSGWYRKASVQMFITGLLSFSAVALEFHHLYASLWGYKICTLPSILFLTFIILVLLTAILSVGMTYIQLTAEDHEWWWRSVFRGGATAIFMFIYSIYFFSRSSMSSFMQLSFFLGYSICLSYAFFLMLGTISFRASFTFVRHIYHAVKSE